MTSIQKIGKLMVFLLLITGLNSCTKDNNEAPFTMIAEVATVKRMMNDEVYYARMYYGYGTQPMSAAKVTLPEGGSLILTPLDASKRTWYKDPELGDFSIDMPPLGQYSFTVVNEDIEHTFLEELGSKNLGFTEITNIDAEVGKIMVEWATLSGADQYKIIVRNEENEIIYSGPLLEAAQKKFEVSASTGLTGELESGKTYTVELMAYIYEDNVTSENYLFNIEEVSITSQNASLDLP